MSKTTARRSKRTLSKLASVMAQIADTGFDVTLTEQSIDNINGCGFRGENLALAIVATNILVREQPITLRGLMYRVVSAGWLPSTDPKHYNRLGRLMTSLRELDVVPFEWIVDGIRSTIKPSSWSGITDFADTVRDAYRMDFWSRLPAYVHIIAEKDAIAGVLAPVTREFDVALSPIRGYCSLSFAHEIASTWSRIDKPVFCYYIGDFDPSGFDLERDMREKIKRYCRDKWWWYGDWCSDEDPCEWTPSCVRWKRLSVLESDFDEFDLLPLELKTEDKRTPAFRLEHGDRGAEVDALPSTELRRRIREAIESHIPGDEWGKLKEIERIEREQFNGFLDQMSGGA